MGNNNTQSGSPPSQLPPTPPTPPIPPTPTPSPSSPTPSISFTDEQKRAILECYRVGLRSLLPSPSPSPSPSPLSFSFVSAPSPSPSSSGEETVEDVPLEIIYSKRLTYRRKIPPLSTHPLRKAHVILRSGTEKEDKELLDILNNASLVDLIGTGDSFGGFSCMELALRMCHIEAVDLLVEKGVPLLNTPQGSLLFWVLVHNDKVVLPHRPYQPMVLYLLRHHVDLSEIFRFIRPSSTFVLSLKEELLITVLDHLHQHHAKALLSTLLFDPDDSTITATPVPVPVPAPAPFYAAVSAHASGAASYVAAGKLSSDLGITSFSSFSIGSIFHSDIYGCCFLIHFFIHKKWFTLLLRFSLVFLDGVEHLSVSQKQALRVLVEQVVGEVEQVEVKAAWLPVAIEYGVLPIKLLEFTITPNVTTLLEMVIPLCSSETISRGIFYCSSLNIPNKDWYYNKLLPHADISYNDPSTENNLMHELAKTGNLDLLQSLEKLGFSHFTQTNRLFNTPLAFAPPNTPAFEYLLQKFYPSLVGGSGASSSSSSVPAAPPPKPGTTTTTPPMGTISGDSGYDWVFFCHKCDLKFSSCLRWEQHCHFRHFNENSQHQLLKQHDGVWLAVCKRMDLYSARTLLFTCVRLAKILKYL